MLVSLQESSSAFHGTPSLQSFTKVLQLPHFIPRRTGKGKTQTDTRSSNELNLYPPLGTAAVNKESIYSVRDISNWLWAEMFQKCVCYLPQ